MPISTPEPRQKLCSYCSTPAAALAVKCENCGSALPLALPAALPQSVARMVQAQSRWSMGKTALVSLLISLLLGSFLNTGAVYFIPVLILASFWVILVLPVMLITSAIMSSRKDAARAILNLLAASGLWILGVILVAIMAMVY